MNKAARTLSENKQAWVVLPIQEKIELLRRIMRDLRSNAQRWVAAGMEAKGIDASSLASVEEWALSPYFIMVELGQLLRSLRDIERTGHPRIPGPVITRPDDQVVAQVFPQRAYDRLFYGGVTAEIWMQPGVSADSLSSTQATQYRKDKGSGKVVLVLGAGNVGSIGPLDVLSKLFVENQVVLYKANPINAYLGPLFEEAFRALIDKGFLRIVYGGPEEGAYLCNHSDIDEVHITGSDKSFDAIVFGTGLDREARKSKNQPLLKKKVTGELGNVSPVIVVPGPWSESDIAYQGELIVSSLTNNAGFNCNATRVVIQHAGWDQRKALVDHVKRLLAKIPPRNAYYPGAMQRYQTFLSAHPEAERFGAAREDQLPWTFVPSLDPTNANDICFTTEAFCGLLGETALPANSVVEFIERAVSFANNTLWGTLNATILVHPSSLKDPAVSEALDRAVAKLRYGSIGINIWAGLAFIFGVTTWGGYPGSPQNDTQSGTGFVHNTLMFDQPQKSVLRAPFRMKPIPPWFATRGQAVKTLFRKLVSFEAAPSPLKIPSIMLSAMR